MWCVFEAYRSCMRGFREFSQGDESRLSSLKECWKPSYSTMRKPSLKCFLKTELNWFKSGQHLPYKRLTVGTCSPLLGVGFWFCRICTHINLKIPNSVLYHAFMFKTRSSRSHTFSLLLSFCWKRKLNYILYSGKVNVYLLLLPVLPTTILLCLYICNYCKPFLSGITEYVSVS